MKRVITAAVGFATLAIITMVFSQTTWAAETAVQEKKADAQKPADRVVVMYFHRTQRCPTCLRMGGYTEEAVLDGFPKEIKAGTVEFHYVDFQDPKNAALVKGYKIGGPTLMVVKVAENKAAAAKNLTEIWTKNRDKEVFLRYVRDNVTASQKPLTKKTAGASRADSSARR
ncbi:MAG TPA: nitrophenyl compound nitroreductase subunit ArsF family protein [Thermoguttaceae bacterium]|nr:nitrophenyl compound nitroreductase subunit ArsF family protein [Thermoguttaceae bacterium]